jgi:TonB-linked SusC/RagA family outer membrane protein
LNALRVVGRIAFAASIAAVPASQLDAQAGATTPRPQSPNNGSITGTITRPGSSEPIDQVSVRVVGTSLGATTNAQGRYTIANVSPGIYVVEATRIGLAPGRRENVNVTAGSSVTVDLTMSERALLMDAVVATGLNDPVSGTKAPFSVARVSAEEIKVPAVGDVLGSLAGKVAGATIRPSGQPGGDLSIQLRSPTSFRGNTQPMIIVDGVIQLQDDPSLQSRGLPGSDLDINPEDIASIEIVRGAAAAALYGQRAASGVIVIRTKRGESAPQGTTRVVLSNEVGVSQQGRKVPLTNQHRFLVDQNNNFIDLFGRPITDRNFVNDPNQFIDNSWGVPIYDHEEQAFGVGPTLSNNLSISQSSLATNFNVQVGASNETGILQNPRGGLERYNIRMNLDHRIGDKVSLSFGTFYNRQFQRVTGGGADNLYNRLYNISQDIDLLATDPATGKLVPFPDGTNANNFNPIYGERERDSWNKRAGLQGSFGASYRPFSILQLSGEFGYQRSDRQAQIQFLAPGNITTGGTVSPGEYDVGADFDESYNGQLRAQVLKAFGGWTTRSSVAMLGTMINNNGWTVSGDTLIQPQADLDFARRYEADQTLRDQNTKSYSVTAGADYRAKYIFDALYRRDGNSLLPASSRWQDNGRLSAAWSLGEENWWRSTMIPFAKLRYSIGTAGNNPRFQDQYETYLQNAGTERIFKQDMGNIELRPEQVTEQEFGFDFSIQRRYGFQLSYIRNYIKNAIRPDTISSYTGFDTQVKNLGDLKAEAYEATLELQWMNRRNLTWSSSLVADRARTTIAKYPRRCAAADATTGQRECEGYQFGQVYGIGFATDPSQLSPRHAALTEVNGTARTQNNFDAFEVNDDGLLVAVGRGGHWTDQRWGQNVVVDGITYQWGMPIVRGNYDAAGLRNGNAAVNFGQSMPDMQYGLTNDIQWGPWNFFTQFTGQLGGLMYNRWKERLYDLELHEDVGQAGKPDYAKKPSVYYTNNPVAASGSSGLAPGARADYFAEKNSYAKLAEIQVRYRLDRIPAALQTFGVKQASIALTGRNLYSWQTYSGYDPEAGTANVRVDDIAYPRYRTYSIRTQFTF